MNTGMKPKWASWFLDVTDQERIFVWLWKTKSKLQEDSRELFLPFFCLLLPTRMGYHVMTMLKQKSKQTVYAPQTFFAIIKKPGSFSDVYSIEIMAVRWLREVPSEFC